MEGNEQKWITSSQIYHDVKSAIKKALYGIGALLLIYILYRLFSFWFFAGLIITSLPLGYLITRITQVPCTLVMSMHIADGEDDMDSFSIYGIPDTMLERFDRTGGDFHYFTTLDGARIAVCDDIDFHDWKIKTPWFAELSNFEFFRTKNAFKKLQDMYIEEVRTNSQFRSMHSALVFKRVASELQKHYNKFDKVMLEPETEGEEPNILQEVAINAGIDQRTSVQTA